MKNAILLAALSLLLASCYSSVENGTLPPQYVAAAKAYEGTYKGQFEDVEMSMVVKVADDGVVKLEFIRPDGRDLLDCGSTVGKLLGIDGDEKSQTLKYADFEFDKGSCKVIGNSVGLLIRENKIDVRIAKYRDCFRPESAQEETLGRIPGRPIHRPRPRPCTTRYLTGTFVH